MKRSFVFLLSLLAACADPTKGSRDNDEDGFGIDEDCDDNDPNVNPGVVEVCGDADAIDNDCSGADDACADDLDSDGYTADVDCDDGDALVNPGEVELCDDDVDNNCDGISTECLGGVTYNNPTLLSAYGTAVSDNYVVFGNPGENFNDGVVAWFALDDVVDAEFELSDAAIVSEGPFGDETLYGVVPREAGDYFCADAEYYEDDTYTALGRVYCYPRSLIQAGGNSGVIETTDAVFTVTGAGEDELYTTVDAVMDVTGDGEDDVMVRTAEGFYILEGTSAGFSGDYVVPDDAAYYVPGDCEGGSAWCGFGRAVGADHLLMSGPGGAGDDFLVYEYPITSSDPSASATFAVSRANGDSSTAILDGFAIGNTNGDWVKLVDFDGNEVTRIDGNASTNFGYHVSTMSALDGDELLIVSAPYDFNHRSDQTGLAYVFNLTENPLPTTIDNASYILEADASFMQCGWRTAGGTIVDSNGTQSVVSISCQGYGGAVFTLETEAPPAPMPPPNDIQSTGNNNYNVKKWIRDEYASRSEWFNSLAQTERVVNGQNQTTGWRLHKIYPDSVLYRMGLRAGDVAHNINGTSLTSGAAVVGAFSELQTANDVHLTVKRNGENLTLHIHFVN